jgi:hypothetical protein
VAAAAPQLLPRGLVGGDVPLHHGHLAAPHLAPLGGGSGSASSSKPAAALPTAAIERFDSAELEAATSHFADATLLGRGSHGAVYKAVLPPAPSSAPPRAAPRWTMRSTYSPPSAARASSTSSTSWLRPEHARTPPDRFLVPATPGARVNDNQLVKQAGGRQRRRRRRRVALPTRLERGLGTGAQRWRRRGGGGSGGRTHGGEGREKEPAAAGRGEQ